MKLILGAAAKPAGGKETFGKEVVRLAMQDGLTAKHLVFGEDILRPTIRIINISLEEEKTCVRNLSFKTTDLILRLWGIGITDENTGRLLFALSKTFGPLHKGPIKTERPE